MMDDQLNLFDFGNDTNGEYINLVEKEEQEKLANWHDYPMEEIIKGNEFDNNYVVCATFHLGCMSQYGLTIEEVRNQIQEEADTKCYHYGNLQKGIYAYSFRVDYDTWWFCIENSKHIVVVKHTGNINDILTGKETICYPACCVYMFETGETGIKQIKNGYGEYKNDIRYKVLCEEFEILEFSKNRIYPDKKPKDFYEAEFTLNDFIKHWGEE